MAGRGARASSGRASCLAALIAITLPVGSEGQAVAQSPGILAPILSELRPGSGVRVRAADALRVEGSFLALEGPQMLVDRDAEVYRVPVDRIEALWVRRPATGRGALLGAMAGTVIGGVLGVLAGEVLCDDGGCSWSTLEAVGLLGASGAVLGLAGGALIGSSTSMWRLAWPY